MTHPTRTSATTPTTASTGRPDDTRGDEGYVGLTREQLIDDILGDRASFDPHQIVYRSLPHILSTPGNVPVFKYLRGVDALDGTGEIKESADVSPKIKKMASKIRAGLPASAVHARKAPTILADIAPIADLDVNVVPCRSPLRPPWLIPIFQIRKSVNAGTSGSCAPCGSSYTVPIGNVD